LLLPENKGKLSEFLHTHSLLDLSGMHAAPDLSSISKLMPLLPRFYSIANSALVFPDEIHLTVAYVTYVANGQIRKGIGSYFLCSYAQESMTPIPIYLQPSNHFTLPDDGGASIILMGPGTGVAPFRAFLQERLASSATGRNWLFFGERNRATDFYYEPFFTELAKAGRLRLDLAFSRDTAEKTYVQHKMYEERKSLWAWLQEGAYFYVCGDAEEMAKDVDAMLHRIAREVGGMTEEESHLYVKRLRAEKRYLTDVY
jgi:sulfite reductase (NADPH) flavoprotein alpha-component